ncbi:MAG: hypothetical protein PHV32_02800 [Eubacteriales bacterium]|nr:hypothetical protein [Eubacteriales bacterium]
MDQKFDFNQWEAFATEELDRIQQISSHHKIATNAADEYQTIVFQPIEHVFPEKYLAEEPNSILGPQLGIHSLLCRQFVIALSGFSFQ